MAVVIKEAHRRNCLRPTVESYWNSGFHYFSCQKASNEPAYTYDPSSLGVEAGGPEVQAQPRLHETLSERKTKKKETPSLPRRLLHQTWRPESGPWDLHDRRRKAASIKLFFVLPYTSHTHTHRHILTHTHACTRVYPYSPSNNYRHLEGVWKNSRMSLCIQTYVADEFLLKCTREKTWDDQRIDRKIPCETGSWSCLFCRKRVEHLVNAGCPLGPDKICACKDPTMCVSTSTQIFSYKFSA